MTEIPKTNGYKAEVKNAIIVLRVLGKKANKIAMDMEVELKRIEENLSGLNEEVEKK